MLLYTKNMDRSDILKKLKSIGLPDKAATVYAALLEMGTAFPSKIAEVTKLNRSTVYKALSDLATRGLVSQIERKNKLCYQIEQPTKLVGFAKNQIAAAEERFERAQQMLPELEGLLSLIPNKPHVRFFEGFQGVMSVYEEHIQQSKPYEMVSFSHVEELIKRLPDAFVRRYIKEKQKRRITARAIFPDSVFSTSYNNVLYHGIDKRFLVEARYVAANEFPFTSDITVFGTRSISMINFHESRPMGVIIEDETIAGMMRMIFSLAWKGVNHKTV